MAEYRHSAHAVTDLKYHIVWITTYRHKVLRGDVAERGREVIRQICGAREVRIIRGAISPDHIHILVEAPPQLSPSKLVQFIKGRSSRLLQQEWRDGSGRSPPPARPREDARSLARYRKNRRAQSV